MPSHLREGRVSDQQHWVWEQVWGIRTLGSGARWPATWQQGHREIITSVYPRLSFWQKNQADTSKGFSGPALCVIYSLLVDFLPNRACGSPLELLILSLKSGFPLFFLSFYLLSHVRVAVKEHSELMWKDIPDVLLLKKTNYREVCMIWTISEIMVIMIAILV